MDRRTKVTGHMAVGLLVGIGQIEVTQSEMGGGSSILWIGDVISISTILVLVMTGIMVIIIIILI